MFLFLVLCSAPDGVDITWNISCDSKSAQSVSPRDLGQPTVSVKKVIICLFFISTLASDDLEDYFPALFVYSWHCWPVFVSSWLTQPLSKRDLALLSWFISSWLFSSFNDDSDDGDDDDDDVVLVFLHFDKHSPSGEHPPPQPWSWFRDGANDHQ